MTRQETLMGANNLLEYTVQVCVLCSTNTQRSAMRRVCAFPRCGLKQLTLTTSPGLLGSSGERVRLRSIWRDVLRNGMEPPRGGGVYVNHQQSVMSTYTQHTSDAPVVGSASAMKMEQTRGGRLVDSVWLRRRSLPS